MKSGSTIHLLFGSKLAECCRLRKGSLDCLICNSIGLSGEEVESQLMNEQKSLQKGVRTRSTVCLTRARLKSLYMGKEEDREGGLHDSVKKQSGMTFRFVC